MYNFSDLRNKEVINIRDGKRLGYICDININERTGQITSVVIPKGRGFLWFFWKNEDYIVPWTEIKTIGDDIIIVGISEE